jgi:CelD/BcsL family acetyltransferase involved in cellulose biosynthesis
MKVLVLRANQLAESHWKAWDRFQRTDPTLDSPYFRPEYTQAVAAIRPDVAVAVLEEGGEPAGFFPFQRGRWGIAKPVGGRMTDFQGIIARQGLEWDAAALVRACNLRGWDFDHLLASQAPLRPWHLTTGESPFMDLSRGFDGYRQTCQPSGPTSVKRVLEKARKLARQVGALRLETQATDPRLLTTLLEWKTAQYRRTKAPNVFAYGWTVRLLERVLARPGEGFAGMLIGLYAGDRLAALEMTLRSGGVLHSWFPAYDVNLAKYSPGLILMVEMARAAAALGIRRIDLGKGDAEYKTSFMSGATILAVGSVIPHRLAYLLRRGWHHARSWLRSGPLRGPVRLAGRWTRPLRGWLALR